MPHDCECWYEGRLKPLKSSIKGVVHHQVQLVEATIDLSEVRPRLQDRKLNAKLLTDFDTDSIVCIALH